MPAPSRSEESPRGNPFIEGRRQRRRIVLDLIKSAGSNGETLPHIQAVLDDNHGVRPETTEGYVQSLKNYGHIVTDGVRWYTPENFPKKNLADFIVESRITKQQ